MPFGFVSGNTVRSGFFKPTQQVSVTTQPVTTQPATTQPVASSQPPPSSPTLPVQHHAIDAASLASTISSKPIAENVWLTPPTGATKPKTLANIYPRHEELKAAALLKQEQERVRIILMRPKLADEHEALAWHEMVSLRGKLTKRDIQLHPIRDRLYSRFKPYADEIADSYFRRLPYRPLAEKSDLRGDAYVGLAGAIDVFDYRRFQPFEVNDSFRKFSRQRIKGAIIDGLRTMQPFSRSISKLRREVAGLKIALCNKLGHQPTNVEFCEFYGQDWGKVLDNNLLEANVYNQKPNANSSCDMTDGDMDDWQAFGNNELCMVGDTTEASLQRFQRDQIHDLVMEILGEDTLAYEIIDSYYFWGNNLRQIAEIFKNDNRKISVPQINKIKNEALLKLRSVKDIRDMLENVGRKE